MTSRYANGHRGIQYLSVSHGFSESEMHVTAHDSQMRGPALATPGVLLITKQAHDACVVQRDHTSELLDNAAPLRMERSDGARNEVDLFDAWYENDALVTCL